MNKRLIKKRNNKAATTKAITIIAAIICLQIFISDSAYAGSVGDAGLDPVVAKLTGWLNGAIGKIIAVTALIFAIVGGAIKFNPGLIAGVFGIGLAAGFGPTVINSLFTATI
ncbi:MAG: hypothetical protein O3C54_05680 [Proteobacteria bacterium]|nr:hypothetical protein [Pseudomonadota bacterium]MDA0938855.1 hypothetical protein [Pseudomonadota bacterium]